MNNPKKILIYENSSIKTALNKLEKSQEKLLICINKNQFFLGVINDGDIRRAILNGAKINSSIKKFIEKDATTLNEQSSFEDANKLLNNRILIIPVINSFNKVVGYYSLKQKIEFHSSTSKEILIVGMGYVGLTLAAILSSIGFKIYGYDNNKKTIEDLKKGKISFYEKGLKKYINANNKKNLIFINKINSISASTYIITVGTHLKKNTKKPNLNHIKDASKKIGKNLKKNDLVILRSTLPVGCTRSTVIPNLEKSSDLKAGKDFYVSFAPERTAEGKALVELKENPQIIGGLDDISSQLTANIFNTFTHSIINVSSLENAEFCKLLDNSYRDHRFAFVNQLLSFCDKKKIDIYEIIHSINHGYKRNDIPYPSPGVGGPCLSKDPYILANNLDEQKTPSFLINNIRKTNEHGPKYIFNKLNKMLKKIDKKITNSKIFLMGLAFKGAPKTSDIRSSTSMDFINLFSNKKNLYVYDPVVYKSELKKNNLKSLSLEKGFTKADAVIILNNNKSFQDLDITNLINKMNKPSLFIDTWRIFDPHEIKQIKGILYGGLGIE
jgi:UDP-N-acetyl-D-mannosaminuronic acid dehydrogenase